MDLNIGLKNYFHHDWTCYTDQIMLLTHGKLLNYSFKNRLYNTMKSFQIANDVNKNVLPRCGNGVDPKLMYIAVDNDGDYFLVNDCCYNSDVRQAEYLFTSYIRKKYRDNCGVYLLINDVMHNINFNKFDELINDYELVQTKDGYSVILGANTDWEDGDPVSNDTKQIASDFETCLNNMKKSTEHKDDYEKENF